MQVNDGYDEHGIYAGLHYAFSKWVCVMAAKKRRDLFPGALEMMILQSLNVRPMHGYALVLAIQRASHALLGVREGSLYPALQRMSKAGLLDSKWEVSLTNRRIRTFRITVKGKKHLARELSSFESMLRGIQLVLSFSMKTE